MTNLGITKADPSRFWTNDGAVAPPDLLQTIATAPAQLGGHERLLIYALVRAISPSVAVEIGTRWGGSAKIIATALKMSGAGHLWAIDPVPDLRIDWSEIADVATLVTQSSPEAIAGVVEAAGAPIEFAFIDGNHAYDFVVADTMGLLPYLAGSACILYHDALNHDVRRAIDHCVATVGNLSDGGIVGRHLHARSWPIGLYGGLRMVHFRDQTRGFYLPEWMMRKPDIEVAEELSPATLELARSVLRRLVDENKTPIAVYGAGRRFTALTEVLLEFSRHIVAIIDDNPLLCGQKRLGWPILNCEAVLEKNIQSVFPTVMNAEVIREGLQNLQSRGIHIARLDPDQWNRVHLPEQVSDPRYLLDGTLRGLYYRDEVRRFALYGAGQFLKDFAPWLIRNLPFIDVVAVADDNPALNGTTLWGIPVVDPSKLSAFNPQCLVTASPTFEKQMCGRRAIVESQGIPFVQAFSQPEVP